MDFSSKYKNKEILIIGGGTSTLDREWNKVSYDYVWTCNDFYKNSKVREEKIDLYQLGGKTNLQDLLLIDKLNQDKPFIYYEEDHYGGKQNTDSFRIFKSRIKTDIHSLLIDIGDAGYPNPAHKAGAAFRLIFLAAQYTKARKIKFVGFDGFNFSFTNRHAFTGQVGLKNSDKRRDWDRSLYSYVNVFEHAYMSLAQRDDCKRFVNLGEGLDYNLGSSISSKYFPLKENI